MNYRIGLLASALIVGAVPTVSAQIVAPAYGVSTYSDPLANGVSLSFDPSGVLYVGHEDNGAPTRIYRIAVGGSPVELYGDTDLLDPDQALYDGAGVISGTPGTVLVGGQCVDNPPMGCIWAVLPTQATTTSIGPSAAFDNVSDMAWDLDGRLLWADGGSQLLASTGPGDVQVIVSSLPLRSVTVDSLNRILTCDNAGVIRIHSSDGAVIENAFTNVSGSSRIRFAPGGMFGTDLYALKTGVDGVLRHVSGDGAVTVIASGFIATGMDFGLDGALYVTNADNPTSGQFRVLRLAPCPGNINSDNAVNIDDLLEVINAWGPCADCPADITDEGQVNVDDLLAIIATWGPCP